MVWKQEYHENTKYAETIQWGFASNTSGIGTYIRYSHGKIGDKRHVLRKWSGNSIGFAHSGGGLGSIAFSTKKEALNYVMKHMTSSNAINCVVSCFGSMPRKPFNINLSV